MTEVYDINSGVEKAVLTRKKIIIFPFGNKGRLVKQILEECYAVKPEYIIDSKYSKYNENIKNLDILDSIKQDEFVIIYTYDDDDVLKILKQHVKEEIIINCSSNISGVSECYVNMWEDRRTEALRLTAMHLKEIDIKGCVAEAGVYKGGFAKKINQFFPDRKLYLFDTFEGFTDERMANDTGHDGDILQMHLGSLTDTNVNMVLSKMPYPNQCVIRKGFFPETAEGITETFCFVNLDMDIYQSIKDGLTWFWNRMEPCGVIMVHDYVLYSGVRAAVDEFCKKTQIGLVVLPDESGTVVLTK